MKTKIEVKIHNPEARLPHRSRESDAGYDICSLEEVTILPGQVASLDSGMSVVAPNGYYITVEGRSSLYKSGVVPFRGIIDGGYCGSFIVSLMNVGSSPYHIKKHDRIAQITLHKLEHMDFDVVEEISQEYNIRGTAGFGSSGR